MVSDLGFPWRIGRVVLDDADECGGERIIEKALIAADGAVVADFSLSAKWFADYVVSKLNGEHVSLNNGVVLAFSALQSHVEAWSRENFGDQKGIEHLAPLIGIGEEIGELVDAIQGVERDKVRDAIADIAIYFLDFCSRSGVMISDFTDFSYVGDIPDSVRALSFEYGKLCHVSLKRHQGIRGFDADDHYRRSLATACSCFLSTIDYVALVETGRHAHDLAAETWSNIVSRRNWKKPEVSVNE